MSSAEPVVRDAEHDDVVAICRFGEPVGPPLSIAVGASTTSCLWRPTSGRRSSLTVTVATGLWANRALRAARRRGQPVANTGDEAFLLADRTCVVRCGSQIMKLILRDAPGPDSARILVRLAGLAVDRVEIGRRTAGYRTNNSI